MKKILLTLVSTVLSVAAFSATWQISASGFTFSPSTITIQEGDNVDFILPTSHDAVEVSLSTWDANGNSPIVGFSVPFGGGMVNASALTIGTHYYVCEPHASMGMKGQIIVVPATGLKDLPASGFEFYPNPVVNDFKVKIELAESMPFEISLFDLQGKQLTVFQSGIQASGLFERQFSLGANTVAGVYLLKIRMGDKSIFRKLVVI
ncbi:MAG TPA: T9SS type A sorting domain-containing protein [Paludibacter sp.]|nr:T9SS type A sorting domain-containing protein [Paludibacter sp.]